VSRGLIGSVVRGLTRNVAFTAPDSVDDRLVGRTYAVPFDDVWHVSSDLMSGGLKRWELIDADDQEGILRGVAGTPLSRLECAVTVRITLDPDAQTRVDGLAASRTARADLGANARALHRFFMALDRGLEDRRGRPIASLRFDPSTHDPRIE
jgi:hypothetical protein